MTARLPAQIIPENTSRRCSRCAPVPLSDRRTLSAAPIANQFVSSTLRPPVAAGLEVHAANGSEGSATAKCVDGDKKKRDCQATPPVLIGVPGDSATEATAPKTSDRCAKDEILHAGFLFSNFPPQVHLGNEKKKLLV